MDKAEKRAREAYPYEGGMKGLICENSIPIFVQGYHQAEKDLEAKYKVLMDYCKGALYHWGVENDDCLAGLAKILEDIDNNKEQ